LTAHINHRVDFGRKKSRNSYKKTIKEEDYENSSPGELRRRLLVWSEFNFFFLIGNLNRRFEKQNFPTVQQISGGNSGLNGGNFLLRFLALKF